MSGIKTVALAGLGGYGHIYVNALLGDGPASQLQFVAGIDPFAESCKRLEDIKSRGVRIFRSMEEFCDSGRADLMIISTPLQLHCEQACLALSRGMHVLVEKPLGAHPHQVREMIAARDRAGLQLAIGYQWSFSPTIQQLKRDIGSGRFGKPKRLRTRVYWPRDEKYYRRTPWAGKQCDADGRPVFDSPANNACAHHLHNMFYVLGDAPDRSDWPATVQAELYRAHRIENFDTIALHSVTEHGVEIFFYASHTTRNKRDPLFAYEFENATIYHGGKHADHIVAEFTDGTRMDYGAPTGAESSEKLLDVVASISAGRPVACGPEAAGAQTACIYAAQQSMPAIVDFPAEMVVVAGKSGEQQTYVKDLEKSLNECFDQARLPSEMGFAWAASGTKVSVSGVGGNGAADAGDILRPVQPEVKTAAPRRYALKS